jgi:Dockerin type I domain
MTLPASPMTASLSRRQPCPGGALPMAVTSVVGHVGSLWCAAVFLFSLIGVLFGPTQPSAHALSFNLTFDSSTVGAPAEFFTAFNDAIQFYETNFTDPITINLQVGWGKVNGQDLTPGFLGESQASQPGFFQYGTIKSRLVADAKSAADLTSIANMPASDFTNGATFKLSRAQGKALGLTIGDGSALDGSVGFDKTATYTFDPNNRSVAGKVDFIGLAGHEITEVMGRFGLGQAGTGTGQYGAIDLFRYTSPGVLDLVPANGAYFSIDGGATVINTFNGTGGGDLSDWAGATSDSYNAFFTSGVKLATSAGDVTMMDVIGYDRLLPGDFNRDGQVNAADIPAMVAALADLNAYQTSKNLSEPQLVLLGDIDGDGAVTNADLQALLTLLKSGGGSVVEVPEPESIVLMALAASLLATSVRAHAGRQVCARFTGR